MSETISGWAFPIQEGVNLRLPPTALTEDDQIVLVAAIARAFGLVEIDRWIRANYIWAFVTKAGKA